MYDVICHDAIILLNLIHPLCGSSLSWRLHFSSFIIINSPFHHPSPQEIVPKRSLRPFWTFLTQNLLIDVWFGGNHLQCISIPLFQAHLWQISRPPQNSVKSHLRHLRMAVHFSEIFSEFCPFWVKGEPFIAPPKLLGPRTNNPHRVDINQQFSAFFAEKVTILALSTFNHFQNWLP